jgi:hypothetical protein
MSKHLSPVACIRPAPGRVLVVPGQEGRHLRAEGENVELSQHWLRALARGDAVRVEATATAAAPKKG